MCNFVNNTTLQVDHIGELTNFNPNHKIKASSINIEKVVCYF